MPGIVGLVTKMPPAKALGYVNRMAQSLHREDFYNTGMWKEESLGLYVGWTARRGSFCDVMPQQNERGDVTLIFSGEEFPEPGTAQRLKQSGHEFHDTGPSYLVHQYEENPSFLAGLNGKFHGILADRRRGRAVLFNDRYAMHRLYYHESSEAFYFSAEAKAILAVCSNLRRINPRGLGEFVSCGAVLENRTIFDGIYVLPPSSAWVFENGSLQRKAAYFDPSEWEEQQRLDSEAFFQELQSAFIRNLSRYVTSAERTAMSLTGGLDSRIILACRKLQPGSLPCYTFGSMFRENRDVHVARQVAEVCGQSHQIITAGKEFLSQFNRYAERAVYVTDGCVDVGRAPDLYLSEKAREIAPARITGTYGGEILRGVRAFRPLNSAPSRLFCREFHPYISGAAATYAQNLRGHPVSFAVFKQCPWSQYGVLALEGSQLSVRSPYLDNDFVRTVFRAPVSALADAGISLRLIRDGNPTLLGIPTDRGLAGKRGRIARTTAHGILEFLFKAEYASDMGMSQWLAQLDHTFSPLRLEHIFLGRHKVFHFRVWYRDALAGYIQETLLDADSLARPYIERRALEAAIRNHVKGNRNHTNEIHQALTLEIVHRLFLDNPERGGFAEHTRPALAEINSQPHPDSLAQRAP